MRVRARAQPIRLEKSAMHLRVAKNGLYNVGQMVAPPRRVDDDLRDSKEDARSSVFLVEYMCVHCDVWEPVTKGAIQISQHESCGVRIADHSNFCACARAFNRSISSTRNCGR